MYLRTNVLRKTILTFLAAAYAVAGGAQTSDVEQKLVHAGFENVAHLKEQGGDIVVFENSTFKLDARGIQTCMDVLKNTDCARNTTLILLDNNVPQLRIDVGEELNSQPQISYRLGESWAKVKALKRQNRSLYKVDIVVYPELMFRNIKLNKVYDVVVNLSPALEISLWPGMRFTGQVIFPIVNQYGERYATIRPGFVTLSQALRLPANWFARATVGMFSQERWGMDLRLLHPFAHDRFAVTGEASWTGPSAFDSFKWHYGDLNRVSWNVGATYYIPRWNVQCGVSGGQYLWGDYGARADLTRHFKAVSLGFYIQKSSQSSVTGSVNGGFYFAIALPPYKHRRGRVGRITTADHFGITYNAGADEICGQSLRVSPGENVSQYNFNPYFMSSQLNKIKK